MRLRHGCGNAGPGISLSTPGHCNYKVALSVSPSFDQVMQVMKVNKPVFLALVSSMFTGAASAAAQEPPPAPQPSPPGSAAAVRFGAPGTLAISSDANVGFFGSSVSGGASSWTFVIVPAADYFLSLRGFSIGGQISYMHGSPAAESTIDSFGIGPRAGYNIPINDLISIWPKLAFIFADQVQTGARSTTFDVQLYAPVLFHLAPHFFVGLGPQIQTDLIVSASAPGAGRTTSYGLYFTIGGWTMIGG